MFGTHCSWCQKKLEPNQRVIFLDHLTLHFDPQKPDTKSCHEHYVAYCKYIKEKT